MWYRFYVRSKVAKNGSGFGIGFANDQDAEAFITALNPMMANNAKVGCVKTVHGVTQADYQLPPEAELTASCSNTYLLMAEDPNQGGALIAKKWVKIPSMNPAHSSHVSFAGAEIFTPAGDLVPVTKVIHVSSKFKDVVGSEVDGEGLAGVDGDYTNEPTPWDD